ncbi:MAG: HesA/MoeB/ThiF family protein, partial [Bacteroidota bacterium]
MKMDIRYSRQMALPGWGVEGQRRLRSSSVLVVGVGGLGSTVLMQLVSAGVGRIAFFDSDVVTLSNLNRQFLFKESDIGFNKALTARRILLEIDAKADLEAFPFRFEPSHAERSLSSYDIIVDCTDDPFTRIMMSDAAALAKVPLIHASLFRFEGHLTMFHHDEAGRRWTLRSVFPDYPDQILSDCSNEGIAGPVAQSVAGMQSMEVLKYLTGIG